MCFLHVSIFYIACFSILSYCIAYDKVCNYKKENEQQVFISITRQYDNKSICIFKETNTKTIRFLQRDTIKLTCHRVAGSKPSTTVQLQWKLEQFNQDLMTTEGIPINIGLYATTLNIDRYDDDLIARCFSNGSEEYNNIYVKFKYVGIENVTDINEDIKNVTMKEGQMVPNEFANLVLSYNAPGLKGNPRVILQDDNIFDSITVQDNGTIYTSWAENKNDLQENLTSIVKTKWVIYVEPASSWSQPFLLGFGGISCIITATIISVCCKYCRKKNENSIESPYAEVYEAARIQPNQYQVNNPNLTPEAEQYVEIPSQNDRVVYAQIDIIKSNISTPMHDSEPYAKIIGVIRPKKKGQNIKQF